MTFTVVDWVDLFSRRVYRDIVISCLQYCIREKGLSVYSYVIMTNHLHLIIDSSGQLPLSDIIRDFKKYTSKQFLAAIMNEPESRREWLLHRFRFNAAIHQGDRKHQVWTGDNDAMIIYSRFFFEQKDRYIQLNPVRAGWVDFPEDYIYSSAYELSGRGDKIAIKQWE